MGTVSRIFHIADLHIRRGNQTESRYLEYSNVFQQVVVEIKNKIIPDESILVICGDIFHHKLQISPPGILLFNTFIGDLSKLLPVFIIQGNHDLLQEDNDESHDIIEAILKNNPYSNVKYLKKTGCFEYQNINFGVVSIQDMLNIGGSSGMVDALPTFPEPHPTKLNIALSHCTVKNCYMHNYTKQTHGVPIEWFKGYKLVLLGDVHLQSTKYNEKNDIYYGYPGSLVQQDFGESVFNHGYLCWDIDGGEIRVSKHHVRNEHGKANIKLENAELVINGENYISIQNFLKYENKPTHIHARMYIKENAVSVRNSLIEEFSSHGIRLKIDTMSPQLALPALVDDHRSVDIPALNSIDTVFEFVETQIDRDLVKSNPDWKKFVVSKENFKLQPPDNLPDIIASKIREKNTKIQKIIEESSRKIETSTGTNVLSIKKIKFDWILSYGLKNVFEFDNGRIVLINAPNGYGKSAFFECILLGLFGEPIPSRYNKASSISIINKQKPVTADSANIVMEFSINENQFRIHRKFMEASDAKNVVRLHCKIVELFCNGERIKTGANVVNKYIEDHLCSVKDFLLATMVTQNSDNDFFRLKVTEQINLLDSVLNIEHVNELCENMKLAKKEYKDVKNHIDTFVNASRPEHVDVDEYSGLESTHNSLTKRVENLTSEVDSLKMICNIVIPEKYMQSTRKEKPETSPSVLKELLHDVEKQINILNFEDTPCVFTDANEITIEQFLEHTDVKYSNIHYNCRTSIRETIVSLRRLREMVMEVSENIELHEGWKPKDMVPIDGFNIFQKKFDTHLSKCENWLKGYSEIPTEPVMCLSEVNRLVEELRECVDESLFKLSDEDIIKRVEQLKTYLAKRVDALSVFIKPEVSFDISHEFINGKEKPTMVFAGGCWACEENSKIMKKEDDVSFHTKNLKSWKRYNKYEERKSEIEDVEEGLKQLENLPTYKKQLDVYQNIIEQCLTWDKYIKYKEVFEHHVSLMKENDEWVTVLPSIKRFEKWKVESTTLTESKLSLNQKISDTQHLLEVSHEYQQRSNTLIDLLGKEKTYYYDISYYVAKANASAHELSSCLRLEKDLYVKLATLREHVDKTTLFTIQETLLHDFSQELSSNIGLFDHLIHALKKFKSWAYNDKLLPVIVSKTNEIVGSMFSDRNLKLCFSFSENVIIWSVIDEGNRVNIEKLSGAQSFAMSLSFRLALSFIGISKFRCSQLFIDEGFCSFDQHNLQQIPNLMANLKLMFEEIIIVTHLSEIKKSANIVVNIARENSTSILNHTLSKDGE